VRLRSWRIASHDREGEQRQKTEPHRGGSRENSPPSLTPAAVLRAQIFPSPLNYNFAEVAAAFLEAERIGQLF
jgi:hypothetical protein